MQTNNQLPKPQDPNCLNCGFPFTGHEHYCPECGQKNRGKQLTFILFIKEIFKGFTSWDAKFWKTLFPLIIHPGKVSKNYIEGKRARYVNPFRFYLTVSIIFFLIVGLSYNIEELKNFKTTTSIDLKKEQTLPSLSNKELDSIKKELTQAVENNAMPLDSVSKKKLVKKIEEQLQDTAKIEKKDFNLTYAKGSRLDKFIQYDKTHGFIPMDDALDSLGYEKNFKNRFLYNRGKTINKIAKDSESLSEFIKKTISYGSVSLFVLLPIFTLFLYLFYIRRNITYVQHLIFVFHTQTVFFLLLSLYFILSIAQVNPSIGIFLTLFLLYLFISMKTFYHQNYLKTVLKFIAINVVYMILATFGIASMTFISLALY